MKTNERSGVPPAWIAQRCGQDARAPLDEIDTVLAGHYGFTAEELDFILNYDIKYRLGRSSSSGEEED